MRKLTLVTIAVTSALTTSLLFTPHALANQTLLEHNKSTSQKIVAINIPAGNLGDALVSLSKLTGKSISVDATLIQGMISPAISGNYNADQTIRQLIIDLPLQLKATTANSLTLVAKDKPATIGTLATAVVQADDLKDGGSEEGYRTEEISGIGPWQGRTLQETPYSINVASEDLLQNLQATSTDQVFKINPLVQLAWPQAQNDTPYIFSRGFLLNNAFARNGVIRNGYNHGLSMEEIGQVEVLTGLSGFLYGPGNVGGMVNMVIKRPTEERFNSVTLGNTSGTNLYAHGDFGGRLGSEKQFGYRVNLVTQGGETAIKHQEIKRNFASIALDWQITDDFLLQVDASKRDYRMDGLQTRWFLDKIDKRPDAKEIKQDTLYSQPWALQDITTERAGINMHWHLNDHLSLRAAYLTETTSRYFSSMFSGLSENGIYNQDVRTNKHIPQTVEAEGSYLFADFNFTTGNIEHKLTAGMRYNEYKQMRFGKGFGGYSKTDFFGPYPLVNPVYVSEPEWITEEFVKTPFNANKNLNFTIGDDIKINDQWSALLGLTHSNIESQSYFSNSSYDESETTPSVSIVYNPTSSVTLYGSYIESLEPGQAARDNYRGKQVINGGEITQPLVSEQYELGLKTSLAGIDLTTALFEIDKPFEYYKAVGEQYQLVQEGRQIHRGVEFTATGQLTEQLTIIGGFTLLDADVKAVNNGVGGTPREVAETLYKMYGEYAIAAIDGLSINASASYTGDFYADTQNTDKLDAYTLVDIGARYKLHMSDLPITLRLNISNLTEEEYWVNRGAIGDGRRISMSANVEF